MKLGNLFLIFFRLMRSKYGRTGAQFERYHFKIYNIFTWHKYCKSRSHKKWSKVSLIVKILEAQDNIIQKWDKYVLAHPYSTMYHLYGWKSVLELVFGYRAIYLAAINSDNSIEGILPSFIVRDIYQRKILVSNPFSNFAGVCASNETAENLLIDHIKQIAQKENLLYCECRQLHKVACLETIKTDFVTFYLKLNEDSDVVWLKSLKAKTRNQVRKAQNSNLNIEFSKEKVAEFYKVFASNMRDLGTPAHSAKFFQSILSTFPKNTEILHAKKDNKTIAAMFLFKFKKVISDPWASSLHEYNRYCPNNLMYWEAIKYACHNGYDYFDLGRSTINSGTYQFKKQWGAEPIPLFYQYYLNKAKAIPMVDAHHNKYHTYVNLWKKIPLLITNFIGPKLVKYLPEL